MLNKRVLLPAFLCFLIAVLALLLAEHRGIIFLAKFTILVLVAAPLIVFILAKLIGVQRSKILLANLLLLGITITVCLIAAEIFIRHLFNEVTSTGDNTSYFALRWENSYTPFINELGFREREIKQQKAANVYRIVVVGDSFTYGQGIAEDDRYTSIIERQLNDSENSHEVLNFGKPGAETIDHIGFLDPILELAPDFILLQWLPNDAEGHDKSGRPQPYRLIPSDSLSGFLHRNSALYYLVNSKFVELQSRIGLIESYEDSMLARFGDPESKDSRRANRELDEFILRVKDNNIGVGMVMFPNLVEVGASVDNYPSGYLFDRVIDICHQHAIQCLDLRPVYASISPASKLWVNRLDPHPGPLANEMAAEAIMKSFSSKWQAE